MSERKALKDGKTLPVKFWNVKPFKATFFQQLKLANALLKEYDICIVLSVLREMKYVYSLANKKLLKRIDELNRTKQWGSHPDHQKEVDRICKEVQPLVTLIEQAFHEEVKVEPKDDNTVILDLKPLIPKKKSTRGLLE